MSIAVAAAANEPSSATFANIASPSKSGSFDIDNPATMTFIHFYSERSCFATDLSPLATPSGDSETEEDKTMTNEEAVVRRVYHAAEGNVMDVQGYMDL